jgi:hypothetical protein
LNQTYIRKIANNIFFMAFLLHEMTGCQVYTYEMTGCHEMTGCQVYTYDFVTGVDLTLSLTRRTLSQV